MKLLFVDDDPQNVDLVAGTIRSAGVGDVHVVHTVEEALAVLYEGGVDVLVMDLFIPLGDEPRKVLGPRARRMSEHIGELGGLVLLDELDRLDRAPTTLLHTACRDFVLLELLGERVAARVRKPAPVEVLLDAVLQAIRERPG